MAIYKKQLLNIILLFSLLLIIPSISALSDDYPQGNFKNSCEKIIVIGHMLEAKCRRKDGSWQHSILYYKPCKGPITNNNGILTCNYINGGGGWTPPGSYKETCNDIRVFGDILSARCQTSDGKWRNSRLDFRHCYNEITNQNGRLTCGRRHHHSYLPRGSYKETCRNLSMQGDVLQANCQRRNGQWRFKSLDVSNCYGNVVNDNGRLECSY